MKKLGLILTILGIICLIYFIFENPCLAKPPTPTDYLCKVYGIGISIAIWAIGVIILLFKKK